MEQYPRLAHIDRRGKERQAAYEASIAHMSPKELEAYKAERAAKAYEAYLARKEKRDAGT